MSHAGAYVHWLEIRASSPVPVHQLYGRALQYTRLNAIAYVYSVGWQFGSGVWSVVMETEWHA